MTVSEYLIVMSDGEVQPRPSSLASSLQVSRQAVSQFLNKKIEHVHVGTLIKYARAAGIKVENLKILC